jgi:hypothetical protein
MAKDVMAEADELLGSVKSVTKKQTVSTTLPDYEYLEKYMESNPLYAVVNTLNKPFIIDWDRNLMPEDMTKDFEAYLADKYKTYNMPLNDNVGMCAVFIDGRTVNFLENFMNESSVPALIPMNVGNEVRIKSQFLINANESVICTATQVESLKRYEKVKMEFGVAEKTYSDWLGFLIFKDIEKGNLEDYTRSFVTYSDTVKGSTVVTETVADRAPQKNAKLVKATS